MCARSERLERDLGGAKGGPHSRHVHLPYYLTLSLNLTPRLRRRVRRCFFKAPMERM